MRLSLFAAFFAILIVTLACNTDTHELPAGNFINPNGSSELAVLMNEMFADAKAAKAKIERGEKPERQLDFEKILTAAATEPQKVASREYKAFADAYLAAVEIFYAASPAEAPQHFNNMVTACMSCHENLCPGPTRRIKKLWMRIE